MTSRAGGAISSPMEVLSKADEVLARLEDLLQEVDMDTATINQITNKLAEEIGREVYEYKALIKVISGNL